MSSQIIRAMTQDGSARVLVINSTELVQACQSIHHTAPTATAAIGRLLTAASLIGSLMEEKQEQLTIGIQATGVTGHLIAVSDYYGNVKAYIENPRADIDRKPNGKLNVGGALESGILYMAHDTGSGEPQTGMIELQSGEIAEDIAQYFAQSEQVPTLCALGVLVAPDETVLSAGGVLVQLLPFASEDTISKLEENAKGLGSISSFFHEGKTLKDVMSITLKDIPYDLFDTIDVDYLCTCSRERTLSKIYSLGKKQISELLSEQEAEGKPRELTTTCRFCGKTYVFSEEDLMREEGEEYD